MLPMPQASMRIIRTSIMPVQPSMKVLRAFLKFQTLLIMPMMMAAAMEARMKGGIQHAGAAGGQRTKEAIGLGVTGVNSPRR